MGSGGSPPLSLSEVSLLYGLPINRTFGFTVISAGPAYTWGTDERGIAFNIAECTLDLQRHWQLVGVHAIATFSIRMPFYAVMFSIEFGKVD
jgi:hypothetical protein